MITSQTLIPFKSVSAFKKQSNKKQLKLISTHHDATSTIAVGETNRFFLLSWQWRKIYS